MKPLLKKKVSRSNFATECSSVRPGAREQWHWRRQAVSEGPAGGLEGLNAGMECVETEMHTGEQQQSPPVDKVDQVCLVLVLGTEPRTFILSYKPFFETGSCGATEVPKLG